MTDHCGFLGSWGRESETDVPICRWQNQCKDILKLKGSYLQLLEIYTFDLVIQSEIDVPFARRIKFKIWPSDLYVRTWKLIWQDESRYQPLMKISVKLCYNITYWHLRINLVCHQCYLFNILMRKEPEFFLQFLAHISLINWLECTLSKST